MYIDQLFLQKRYADEVSLRLDRYHVQSNMPFKAIFRCHICGDSVKNKFKRRGFLLEKDRNIRYFCHNCGASYKLSRYLKLFHTDLYQKYVYDLLRERTSKKVTETPKVNKFEKFTLPDNYVRNLIPISEVQNTEVLKYIKDRKLPSSFTDIFYTDKFMEYVNSYIPEKFSEEHIKLFEHGRIIFPLRDEKSLIFGVIGRVIDKSTPKYLTIKFDEKKPKIFGLDRVDKTKHTWVFEGPIDSLFVNNSLGLAGTDFDFSLLNMKKNSYTIVLDNQPRNKEVISKYAKYIAAGESIVIWPDSLSHKDINDMVIAGYKLDDILSILENNKWSGINAKIRFSKWKKV